MDFKTPEELLGLRKQFPMKPGLIAGVIVGFIILVIAATSFYQIDKDENGVVLRLGKHVRTTGPGFHFKLPLGIESVTPIKVTFIYKEEFGFRTSKAGVRTQYSSRRFLEESLMLTGDLNALEVSWIVQFMVNDPVKLLYHIKNPVRAVRDVSESVLRALVGDYSVDEVLSTKRNEINIEAEAEIQSILNSYDSGIKIVTVKLQDVTPPEKVRAAFNEVNEAKQEKERTINQALQAYNKIIPKASGEAAQKILEAEAYAIQRVNESKGDAQRFLSVLKEYNAAPEITKQRLYLEAMEQILSKPKEKFIMDPAQQSMLPLLDLRKTGEVS